MALEDALTELADKARGFAGALVTEEATKNALVMPFISRVLGYDVFNPAEVVPEFVCDVGIKRGEKIDYAITRDGVVQMLIEAKKVGDPLTLENASQLVRYFHTSQARIAVLTNGRHWHFFTDLDRPNIMDGQPFLRLDLLDVDPAALPELAKLTKDTFDLESVIAAAEELKYVSAIKQQIGEEFAHPSEDMVRMLAKRVYSGWMTGRMLEFFTGVTEKAFKQFTNDRVNARLKTALGDQGPLIGAAPTVAAMPTVSALPTVPPTEKDDGAKRSNVVTTEDELEAFRIVRAILVSDVPAARVFSRDQQSYFGILLDDNNRKPIARLYFDRKVKQIGVFDQNKDQTRIDILALEDIYSHAEALRSVVRHYLSTDPNRMD